MTSNKQRCLTLLFITTCALSWWGCSESDNNHPTTAGTDNATITDLLADAPPDWTEFLTWAEQKLEAPTSPAPLPENPKMGDARWPIIRLNEKKLFTGAGKQSDWTAQPENNAPLARLGPFRSDQPTPLFNIRKAPKASPDGEDALVLMFAGFNVPCEDVGCIDLTLSVPFGQHV